MCTERVDLKKGKQWEEADMGGRPALPPSAMVKSGPELRPTAMCGSMAQLQRGSVDVCGACYHQRPWGCPGSVLLPGGDVGILEP